MPENCMNLVTEGEQNLLEPDNFGFYTNEVKSLLSQDDSLLPYSHNVSLAGKLHVVGRQNGSMKKSCQTKKTKNNAIIIGSMLSESKKERLKSLLRQSVVTLTGEVDEMRQPVLNVCRIRSHLRCKDSDFKSDAITCKSFHKDLNAKEVKSDIEDVKEDVELDENLRIILENDSSKVEDLMERHTKEISSMLRHMEMSLEQLLNILMTTCRDMTAAERQQLRSSIQNLPRGNLDRVAEIIELNKPSEQNSSHEIHIDLADVDNVTLWRLYFYVATVKAASRR